MLRSVPSLTLGFGFKQFSFDHRKQVLPGVSLHAFEIPQALMPCWFSFILSDLADGSTIGLGSLLKGIDLGALATAPAASSSDTTSVVSHSDAILFRTVRARATLARMSSTLAVQMNALGLSLCLAM